jgi:hypothetical protein
MRFLGLSNHEKGAPRLLLKLAPNGLQHVFEKWVEPPTQWVPGALSLGVNRPGSEADHSPPSSAEVIECVELYSHSPIRLHGMMLSSKHRDEFVFTFYLYRFIVLEHVFRLFNDTAV